MNRLIGNSGGGHGHQYVALSGGACTTPTITHISQYNNFNHFDVHHYPQSAKATTTTSSNANRFFPVAATKSIPTPALPIEEQLLQQSQHSQHHLLLQKEQRMSLSDRWAMASSQSEVTEQESLHRNVRKLKIIRNGTDLHQQLHGLEVIHSDGGSPHSPHSPAAHDRDSRRQRQSSDPNIRSMRSPSLPPLSEHTAGSRRSKSRDRGHSLMLRERVNPRRVRRSKLRVIRDQRKGSDPQGFRSRTADRDRAGTKSMSTGTGSLRHSDDEKASEPLTVTDDGGTLSVSAGVRSDHDHHDHHDRYDHHFDDRRLTAKRMSKHCHLRFFVEMNGVWTYSVRFDSALCGLELCPIDDLHLKGAVVVKCHSAFSQKMVVEDSLLIGIGNEIVLQMDHHRILKRIQCSPRPLTLTFYHSSKQRRDEQERNEQYLCLWLGSDGTMRFKSKSM